MLSAPSNHLTFILRERLEILFREAIEIVLNESINNDYVKIAAINTALKITKEQIKLGFALGLIKRKAPEINQNPPLRMPFEFNPVIMQALAESVKQQRAEKKAKN
jgi:hypothetical protein